MWPFYNRTGKLPRVQERVLILGGSRGAGLAIAHEYALAGARLFLVARREDMLLRAEEECKELRGKTQAGDNRCEKAVLSAKADLSAVEDMLALRAKVQEAWGGLDTLVVCAGAMTLRPLLEMAGLTMEGYTFSPAQAERANLEQIVDLTNTVMRTNYTGPMLAATTFIPMLAASTAPAVMLMSSVGAVVPAPTLSVYCSSKAASLMLYQSLAIEHPTIAFTLVLPGVFRGEAFFSEAVGGGPVRTGDARTYGLKHEDVAKRCVRAVDGGEQTVFIPTATGRLAHFLYWVFPSVFIRVVKNMYQYNV